MTLAEEEAIRRETAAAVEDRRQAAAHPQAWWIHR